MVDERNAIDLTHLDFSKVSYTILHDTLINKMEKCRLDKITVKWIYNQLNKHKQGISKTGSMSNRQMECHRGLSWLYCSLKFLLLTEMQKYTVS